MSMICLQRASGSAFETVTYLDKKLVVLDEDEEDGTVAFEFLADLPGFGDADGKVFDGGV